MTPTQAAKAIKRTDVEVLAELERIRSENQGVLAPSAVVAEAESEASILHEFFDWDDASAGHQHRLWQARQLIRVTVRMMESESGKRNVRVYVSLRQDRTEEDGGYRALVDVMGDAQLRAALLQEALADMQTFREKYECLKELVPVFQAMRRAERRATRRKKKA